jgi:hypothetical protein
MRSVAGVKRGLGLHRPSRSLLIMPDDVFLVSFPKSGNTWTRFLLANLISPDQPATFANIRRIIPDPEATNKREFKRVSRARIIKSQECFDPRYPRVIYIVRDPRDVAVSLYHYHHKLKKIADESSIENFVARFSCRRDLHPWFMGTECGDLGVYRQASAISAVTIRGPSGGCRANSRRWSTF